MTRAAYLVRPAKPLPAAKRVHMVGVPALAYPPGYFTELMRQHNWPPMWQPAEGVGRRPRVAGTVSISVSPRQGADA